MRRIVSDARGGASALSCEPWCSRAPCSELKGDPYAECGACQATTACNFVQAGDSNSERAADDCHLVDADEIGRCDLEVVDTSDVSREQLLNRSEPLLIRGATRGWPALENWTKSGLLARYGAETFETIGEAAAELPTSNTTFAELLSWRGGRQRHLLALGRSRYERQDRSAPQTRPNPWDATRPPFMRAIANDFTVPAYFRPAATFQLSWGSGAGAGVPPENHPSAWFASVTGQKRWILTPPAMGGSKPPQQFFTAAVPDAASDGRRRGGRGGHEGSSVCRPRCKTRRPSLQCDVPVGDILWFPNFWYHETCGHDAFSAGIGGVTFRECCQRRPPARDQQEGDDDDDLGGMWVAYTGYRSHLVFEAHIDGDTSVLPGGGARGALDV